MGIFNFLKKDKDSTDAGLELPPVPSIEGMDGPGNFPELKPEEQAPLPDTSLPPLPTDVPGAVPPKPLDEKLSAPKMDLPEPPKMETLEPKRIDLPEEEPGMDEFNMEMPEGIPELPKAPMPQAPAPMPEAEPEPLSMDVPEMPEGKTDMPEFPSIPETPSSDVIPDTIPPLEGLPEAPTFTPEPAPQYSAPKPRAPMMRELPPMTEQPLPEMDRFEMEQETHMPSPAEFIPEQKPQRASMDIKGPMFIRTDRFRQIIENIEHVKSTFSGEDDTFSRISDVKNSQDQRYEDFRLGLEDIQRKLLFIDRSLFETTTRS